MSYRHRRKLSKKRLLLEQIEDIKEILDNLLYFKHRYQPDIEVRSFWGIIDHNQESSPLEYIKILERLDIEGRKLKNLEDELYELELSELEKELLKREESAYKNPKTLKDIFGY